MFQSSDTEFLVEPVSTTITSTKLQPFNSVIKFFYESEMSDFNNSNT